MRRLVRAAAVGSLLAGSALAGPMPAPQTLPTPQPHIGFAGGDGSSCAAPVLITGANHEAEGVRAERWWIFTKNPGAMIEAQHVAEQQNGKDLETVTLLDPDGSRKTVCFDITSFYGKP